MSDTKSELERTYTVPLSRAWIAPRHRRTRRAVNILKEFAQKHMKSSDIKIETDLNERLWNRGITRPPRRIKVNLKRDEDGMVTISLPKEESKVDSEHEETESSKEIAEKDQAESPKEEPPIKASSGQSRKSTKNAKSK